MTFESRPVNTNPLGKCVLIPLKSGQGYYGVFCDGR